jgi:hypothetical protein
MHLMLTLRESEASRYTERDTPIFVGQHVEIRAALDALDGFEGGRAGRAGTASSTASPATPSTRVEA